MIERRYEIVLTGCNGIILTRYCRTFSSYGEATTRLIALDKELDRQRYPSVRWIVCENGSWRP